ncbi:MAG: DUF2179 domain-containing protein [Leptospiraceae bacterium]|nr:DUF2179 domain-containing protein [Leptospiraceae bacterium]MCP5496938.1 DUF2179 domain-containing protein [Leptospiraceae bacterium]
MEKVFFEYILVPLLIMIARMLDVSIGTIRIIFVSKGKEKVAASLGFIEVIIWLIAITQVLKNLTNPISYIAFAIGFSLGNIIGIKIERKLAVGMQIIRIIKKNKLRTLQLLLRDEGYGVTTVIGQGGKNDVEIVYVVLERRKTKTALKIVEMIEPDSFVTIQDILSHQKGFFKAPQYGYRQLLRK